VTQLLQAQALAQQSTATQRPTRADAGCTQTNDSTANTRNPIPKRRMTNSSSQKSELQDTQHISLRQALMRQGQLWSEAQNFKDR